MVTVVKYYENVKQGDTSLPGRPAQLSIAETLDHTTKGIVEGLTQVLQSSPEHKQRVKLLLDQPRTAGKFAESKIILEDISPFEQMVALSDVLARRKIKKTHSYFFGAENDDHIPVQVKPQSTTTMMHAVLGSTRGERKAPKYTEWAQSDPRKDSSQKRFIPVLEALEIVRQPQYSAATILKGSAFDTDYIDEKWRYGSTYACVEDKGQAKDTPKKNRSAGLNACTLLEHCSDYDDPYAEDKSITLPLSFDEYLDRGIIDETDFAVSSGGVIQDSEEAIMEDKGEELTRDMEKLTISRIGSVSTPALANYIGEKVLSWKT